MNNFPTVQDVLGTKEFSASNGETVSGRQYLEDAITAFNLQPCDYNTILKLLSWIAQGYSADVIVQEIQEFWQQMDTKYGK